MNDYQTYFVETFRNPGEPSDAKIRVRPLKGQGIPVDLRVECNREMRKRHPVGTKFKITAKLTSKEGGKQFLYSHYNSDYDALTDEEIEGLLPEYKKKKVRTKKRTQSRRPNSMRNSDVDEIDEIEKEFQQGLKYSGKVVSAKGNYYVLEAQDRFVCLYESFVQSQMDMKTYYLVSKRLVRYVDNLLKEQSDITVAWLAGRMQRSRHKASNSELRNTLYVLTSLEKLTISWLGERGEIHFYRAND